MSLDNLAYVKKNLLEVAQIDNNVLMQGISTLLERKLDFGDLFFEHEVAESFSLDENIIKGGGFSISSGVGVRAILGEKCGFAYADAIDKNSLLDACMAARSISRGHNCDGVCVSDKAKIILPQFKELKLKALYAQDNPLLSLERERKIEILKELNAYVRDLDKRVEQVSASLSQVHRMMLVVNTDGTICADVKPVVQLSAQVVMKDQDKIESAHSTVGGAYLLDRLNSYDVIHGLAKEIVRQASISLDAIEAPAGVMPVVLAAGWPGVLIHEAVGHGLEADANYTKMSAYTDKIGTQVASSACTIVDDGTLVDRRGSQSCDDEGTPSQRTVLIENGVLKSYMHDKKSAMLMHTKPTGNGRRESYDSAVMPRMTNTYLMPGKYKKDEVIASVDKGIYAVNFKGGQVDITSGRFVFSASEAYLIEKGKITAPIKGATLIGNGPQTMQKVSMVADDLAFDNGYGYCGKGGQTVMVGIGQPTVKVDEITVGGTAQ